MAQKNRARQIKPGEMVKAGNQVLGQVEQVFTDKSTGKLNYITVNTNSEAGTLNVPADMILPGSPAGEVHLVSGLEPAQAAPSATTPYYQGQDLTIPVAQERLKVDKREVDLGELRLQKVVDTVEETQRVPLTHDEFVIDHVPVNQYVANPVQPFYRGDILVIPIMKEVLVVQKQLVVVEEVHVSRRPVTEEKEVKEKVRRERVEVQDGKQYVHQQYSSPTEQK